MPPTLDGFSGGVGGATPHNVYTPFAKSAPFPYHSVNSTLFLYHLVTSATVF